MWWTRLRAYYGLTPPFNFNVALPFLISISVLSVVVIVWGAYFSVGAVAVLTMRFYFFLHLTVLLILATIVSRIYIASYIIVSWCIIELALAFSPITYAKRDDSFGVARLSLFPMNYVAYIPDHRFKYHPLMQVVPKENWRSKLGVRITHNRFGWRGHELDEGDLEKQLIYVYGGSTTYDVAVDQGKTWPEMLELYLGRQYSVINFGVPGYSSSENLIQTAFYEKLGNRAPICALYYLGWNDIHNAYIRNLDPAYADFHLRYQPTQLSVRKSQLWGADYSPVLRVVSEALQQRFDTMADARYPTVRMPAGENDTHFEQIYRDHVTTITSINSARHVATIYVGQILNKERLESKEERDSTFDWTPYSRNRTTWTFQSHFNSVLEEAAISSGAKYIDAGVENFRDADFVDFGHFSAAGSAKFARLIAVRVRSFCQLPTDLVRGQAAH